MRTSNHAKVRMKERNLRQSVIDLVRTYGTRRRACAGRIAVDFDDTAVYLAIRACEPFDLVKSAKGLRLIIGCDDFGRNSEIVTAYRSGGA